MGFPVYYSELPLPRALLRISLLLGYVRWLVFLAFNAVGLGDLLDVDVPWPETSSSHDSSLYGYQRHNQQLRWASATLIIEEALPVVRYEELAEAAGRHAEDDGCAVCLCEFERGDEVRWLSNCRHVFHRGCLDRWVAHDQSTCPLCRTPLVTGETPGAVSDRVWADSYYDDFSFLPWTPIPTSSLPDQLVG